MEHVSIASGDDWIHSAEFSEERNPQLGRVVGTPTWVNKPPSEARAAAIAASGRKPPRAGSLFIRLEDRAQLLVQLTVPRFSFLAVPPSCLPLLAYYSSPCPLPPTVARRTATVPPTAAAVPPTASRHPAHRCAPYRHRPAYRFTLSRPPLRAVPLPPFHPPLHTSRPSLRAVPPPPSAHRGGGTARPCPAHRGAPYRRRRPAYRFTLSRPPRAVPPPPFRLPLHTVPPIAARRTAAPVPPTTSHRPAHRCAPYRRPRPAYCFTPSRPLLCAVAPPFCLQHHAVPHNAARHTDVPLTARSPRTPRLPLLARLFCMNIVGIM
ncbi:hypothetical protein B0H11DRAFT_2262773 [Mycena galericulata]|nr:hypothetical protein B0H11DRAFT_2262773 [Mycena galericulata]